MVECEDGSKNWVPLEDIKISNNIEVEEYATGNRIEEEPDLKLWVKDVLMRRNCIIEKFKYKYWCTTHNFGVDVPK